MYAQAHSLILKRWLQCRRQAKTVRGEKANDAESLVCGREKRLDELRIINGLSGLGAWILCDRYGPVSATSCCRKGQNMVQSRHCKVWAQL